MSQFATLEGASSTFRSMVWEAVRGANEASGKPILPKESQVTLSAPYDIRAGSKPKKSFLSVFLYRVQPSPSAASAPPGVGGVRSVSLAVDLFYLITPLTSSPESDQKLLGLVLKRLHDEPILTDPQDGIGGPLQPALGTIRIVQLSPSADELFNLWNAFHQPLHLAVAYSLGPIFLT